MSLPTTTQTTTVWVAYLFLPNRQTNVLGPKPLTSLTWDLERQNNSDLQQNWSRLVIYQSKDRRSPVLTKPANQQFSAKTAYFAYFGRRKIRQQ